MQKCIQGESLSPHCLSWVKSCPQFKAKRFFRTLISKEQKKALESFKNDCICAKSDRHFLLVFVVVGSNEKLPLDFLPSSSRKKNKEQAFDIFKHTTQIWQRGDFSAFAKVQDIRASAEALMHIEHQ